MKQIELTRGYVATVDDADYEWLTSLGSWSARETVDGRVYAQRAVGRTTEQMHRVIAGHALVDHINGDGLDNRRSNLRPATVTQNNRNARRRKDNRSGFKGVTRQASGLWRARITVDGLQIRLGTFDAPEDAARAYDAAAIHHFGEFARLNFPTKEPA